jgi:hypothetical protein
VREAVFTVFFEQLGLPRESALALSFLGWVLIMLFSTSGAVAYLSRRRGSTGVQPGFDRGQTGVRPESNPFDEPDPPEIATRDTF